MEEDSDLSTIRMFMEQFSINDEEASKMNIPSNYNHYAQGDMHKIIQEYSDYTKVLFKEILDTYDWGKNDRSDIKKMILSIIYPEKYLKDQAFITFTLVNCYDGTNGMEISIPGPGYLWDSIHHIRYLLYYCIKKTKLYHLTYNTTQKDKILSIILNGYSKSKIMGLSARMRENLPRGSDLRAELNGIVHCEERKETNYKRKDNYKGIGDEEMLNKSRSKIIEIIKRYPKFRNLLDEKEDMERRYELDIIYLMNSELEQITIMIEDKLNKIKMEIHKAGGTAEYVMKNEIGYKLKFWENEVKSQLFDEIVDHTKNNNWGITWGQRRELKNKLNKIYEEKILEKIRYHFEEEKKNIRINTMIIDH